MRPDSLLQIHLTALANVTNTANGNSQDSGTIINLLVVVHISVIHECSFTAAQGRQRQQPGGSLRGTPFTHTIAFRNTGDVTARNPC